MNPIINISLPEYKPIEVIIRVRGLKPKHRYLSVVGVQGEYLSDKSPLKNAYNRHILLDFSAN